MLIVSHFHSFNIFYLRHAYLASAFQHNIMYEANKYIFKTIKS